jgi:hypothetical protein
MFSYTLDPNHISLERFRQLTRDRQMIPSRVELQEEMEKRFKALSKMGISDLGELISTLGSKSKVEVFSQQSGLPVDYLVLLKREAGSYLARPFPLSNFPGIPFEYTEVLKSKGIKTSRDLFEKVQSPAQRSQISKETGIPVARLEELWALCDLSRITGVGGVFARVVYEAGIRSVKEFAETQANSHYLKYMAVIEKFGYSAGHFSEGDIQFCIDYARVVNESDQGSFAI